MKSTAIEQDLKEVINRIILESPELDANCIGAFLQDFARSYVGRIEHGLEPRPSPRRESDLGVDKVHLVKPEMIDYDMRIPTLEERQKVLSREIAWFLFNTSQMALGTMGQTLPNNDRRILSLPYHFSKREGFFESPVPSSGYAFLNNYLVRCVPTPDQPDWIDIFPVLCFNGFLVVPASPYIEEVELVPSIDSYGKASFVRRPTGRFNHNPTTSHWIDFPDITLVRHELGRIVMPGGPNTNKGLSSIRR